MDDYRSAGLEARHVAMLSYADKLTRSPAEMVPEDVTGLRRLGFADAAILAIAETTAYYAYANRIVAGLGVELEDEGDAQTPR